MEWSPEKGETNNPGDALFDNWAMNQKKTWLFKVYGRLYPVMWGWFHKPLQGSLLNNQCNEFLRGSMDRKSPQLLSNKNHEVYQMHKGQESLGYRYGPSELFQKGRVSMENMGKSYFFKATVAGFMGFMLMEIISCATCCPGRYYVFLRAFFLHLCLTSSAGFCLIKRKESIDVFPLVPLLV